MKRSNRIVGLLGVLAVACAATYGVMKYEEEKELIKNSDEIILELDADSVTALSWEYDQEYLSFHKDETWKYDEDEAFPVDEEKISSLLELFESFGVSFAIEDVEDLSQYGLDDPMCTITVETGEETYKLQLGDYSVMDSERYVTLGDGMVYLVKEDPFDTFELTISDMIKHDEIPDMDKATEIVFAGAENETIVYDEDSDETYGEYDVYFMKDGEEVLPLDTSTMNKYLRTIRNLDPTDYVTYNATEEELETYGMNEPEMTITMTYSETDEETEKETEGTFVLNISRDPKELEKLAKKSDSEEESEEDITAYVRIGESQIVYKIADDDYKDLMAVSYNDLRHKEVVMADFDRINQFDISLEGADYTITTKGNSEGRTYFYNEEELEIGTFETALTALKTESADTFTDEEPTEKEEISLVLHLDNTNFPEVSVKLYRYDGSSCLAVVDGKPVSLIKRSQVVDLIEAVYAIVLEK